MLPLTLAAIAAALLPATSRAQTSSSCNPIYNSCPARTGLGMTIHVDFTDGSVNSFSPSGSPTYGSDGVTFSVAKGGDAPQLASVFYIMFGRVEVSMRAAPGAGIVSSLVLQSDDLDEIDIEWLGADPDEIQTNYFGKGNVATYNRGQYHSVPGTQAGLKTYTVDWTQNRIVWAVDGVAVRELRAEDAEQNQYPQTPMQVKFGAWSGGDSSNSAGTIDWARGPTDYAAGPFSMLVASISVTDYSTGREYRYTDQSGSWQSIEAVDGEVNGNADGSAGSISVTAASQGSSATNVPTGIGTDSGAANTQTGWPYVASAAPTGTGSIPAGWRMTDEGKIVPDASTTVRPSRVLAFILAAFVVGRFALE